MARFYGVVGYGVAIETSPGSGVHVYEITTREYSGDVIRNSSRQEQGDKANADLTLSNSISIVVDQYATEHFSNIKFVVWDGVYWTVTSVEVRRPRLILEIGGIYNGPKV